MARKTKSKRPNGAGDSVTVYFDKNDPQESRALEMAKLLAGKHGRRKQVVIAVLEAMYLHFERTGELLTSTAVANAITSTPAGFSAGGYAYSSLSAPAENAHSALLSGADIPATERRKALTNNKPNVTVDAASGRATAQEIANNFLNSMKGLSSGFFD